MHALILAGSRNPEGQTARCANAIAKGLTKAGATLETVFLPNLKLERCRQCDLDGRGMCRREEKCIIDDDFATLIEKIGSTDAVIFANPVYFSDLSESLRVFLDRLRRVFYQRKGSPIEGKPAIGVCMAGSGGGGAPPCCLFLDNILRISGFNVIDVIPVRRQNIEKRIPMLEKTGQWLATTLNTKPRSFVARLRKLARRMVSIMAYLVYYRIGRVG